MMSLPLDVTINPIVLFKQWLSDAERNEANDPNAMCLATSTPDGKPSVRMVLLKGVDTQGFVFYTNMTSRKATEIKSNPYASLCFHWKSLRRQVRVEGHIEPVTNAEADAYFASRSRVSQLGAWASAQSSRLEDRAAFEARVQELKQQYEGQDVPRPPYWTGNRVVPSSIEFWLDMPYRLHDRTVFERVGDGWQSYKLYP